MDSPTTLYEDNQGATELSKNPKFHNRRKHIDISYHFIRERVLSKEISVTYCSADNMLADAMTKGSTIDGSEKFRSSLNVHPVDWLYLHSQSLIILWHNHQVGDCIVMISCHPVPVVVYYYYYLVLLPDWTVKLCFWNLSSACSLYSGLHGHLILVLTCFWPHALYGSLVQHNQ